MLIVGTDYLRQAEVKVRNIFYGLDVPSPDLLADLISRVSELGRDFYSDFYYPIGGISQVLRSTTPATFARSLSQHSSQADTIVNMIKMFDFHAQHFTGNRKYYAASESKGYALVKAINGNVRRETGVSIETSEKRWKLLRSNATLIYAASTIKTSNNKSLLESIREAEASYSNCGHLLPKWIGRARYISNIVFRNFTRPEIGRENVTPLPVLPCEATPEPYFTASEQKIIEANFNIAKLLGSRRRTERRSTVI